MLQALLVVPAFGLVYLVAAPVSVRRRVVQLTLACVRDGRVGGVVGRDRRAVAGGVAPVHRRLAEQQRPRPDLRVQRLRPPHRQRDGQRRRRWRGQGGRWGPTGLTRMFGAEFGGQISWLLPAALILSSPGSRGAAGGPRTDRVRAAFILWGGWLARDRARRSASARASSTRTTPSRSRPRSARSSASAPACCGSAVTTSKARARPRRRRWSPPSIWTFELLERTPAVEPVAARRRCCCSGSLRRGCAPRRAPPARARSRGRSRSAAIGVALAAPGGLRALDRRDPHTGAIPSAGPAGAGGFGFPGGGPRSLRRRRRTARLPTSAAPPNGGGSPTAGSRAVGGRAGGGGAGGLLNGSTPSTALDRAARCRRAARTRGSPRPSGANQAAGLPARHRRPVMAIGGFNGTDPTPTLAQFQQYVREGKVHYFIGGGGSAAGSAAAASAVGGAARRARRRRSRRGSAPTSPARPWAA